MAAAGTLRRAANGVLLVSLAAYAVWLGAANAARAYTFQLVSTTDAALYLQMLHAAGEGRGLDLTLEATSYERAGLADRAHFTPVLLALGPLDRLFDGPLPWFFVWAAWYASAAIPLYRVTRCLGAGWGLSALAAAAWTLYPYTLRAGLSGLREAVLLAPFALWALYGLVSRRPALFLWTGLAAWACREEAGVLLAAFAVPVALAGPGPPRVRLRRALLPAAFGAAALLALGLFRVRPSEFIGADWFPLARHLLAGREPGGAEATPSLGHVFLHQAAPSLGPPVDRARFGARARQRLEVVGRLGWPSFLPALLAPEIALPALPFVWGAVFAYPLAVEGVEELAKDHHGTAYHLAPTLPLLFVATAVGLARVARGVARLAPRRHRRRTACWAAAALGLSWIAAWVRTPQGPLGADPWTPFAEANEALPCWRDHPPPDAPVNPVGVTRRFFLDPAPCREAIRGAWGLASRVPEDGALVVDGVLSLPVARREWLWAEWMLREWTPRFERRADWVLSTDPRRTEALPGRWEPVGSASGSTLWRRSAP